MEVSQEILSDIVVYNKYAKFNPQKKRRETWEELVTRNKEMHQIKFPQLKEEIEEVYKLVYDKKILPSMRSLQFSGKTRLPCFHDLQGRGIQAHRLSTGYVDVRFGKALH